MFFNIWPYLLRLSVSFYFLYPHALALLSGFKRAGNAVFLCVNATIPAGIAFTLWHSFFVILGILILIWPRPILPLIIALVAIASELYINFAQQSYTVTNMLLFVLLLVTLALIIYHARPQYR